MSSSSSSYKLSYTCAMELLESKLDKEPSQFLCILGIQEVFLVGLVFIIVPICRSFALSLQRCAGVADRGPVGQW